MRKMKRMKKHHLNHSGCKARVENKLRVNREKESEIWAYAEIKTDNILSKEGSLEMENCQRN